MAKANEIAYLREASRVLDVPLSTLETYVFNKPFSDPHCPDYLIDLAQIMRLLPPAPARVLDLGVGSGWTTDILAKAGYISTGLDISPDMIELAKRRSSSATFTVADYEEGPIPGEFDAAVIYDALHHADDERRVIANVYNCLSSEGVLVTIEPGLGHSTAGYSRDAVKNYGTTEKDMPYRRQRAAMLAAGFRTVEQYARISQLPLRPLTMTGSVSQLWRAARLAIVSALRGFSSVVVARK